MESNLIVEITKDWLGTPYKHQHATKGQGCDCLGLVRGVYKEYFGYEPETAPPYSPSWAEAGADEILLLAANKHLKPVDTISAGSVLIFRMRPNSIAKHCGIVVAENKMIHAVSGRKVEEVYLTESWLKKVAQVFDFPEK